MPIFEYQCPTCGKVTEKIQSKPQTDINCPVCSAVAGRRVSCAAISTTGNSCGSGAAVGGFT